MTRPFPRSDRDAGDPSAGARNLLQGCVDLSAGERVLLVRDTAPVSFYEPRVSTCIAEEARRFGADVRLYSAPAADGPEAALHTLTKAMEETDHTIFLSPIGDRIRFRPIPGQGTKTMCYALDLGLLGAEFCRIPHQLLVDVHDLLVNALAKARTWRITCPLGTDVTGSMISAAGGEGLADDTLDFTLALFPVMIFPPLSCADMSGRVVLSRWLTTTSTHDYDDGIVVLPTPVAAVVERGRIVGFEGPSDLVRTVEAHYGRVSDRFGLDPGIVGSWHTGINPKTFYPRSAADDVARWASVAFGSPRYTHFHTCGQDPGEICWSVFDATIALDGRDYWRDGEFVFLQTAEARELLSAYPGAETAFDMRWDIGL